MNLHNASKRTGKYDLRNILKDSLVNVKPNDAVTFVDNHEYVDFVYLNDAQLTPPLL